MPVNTLSNQSLSNQSLSNHSLSPIRRLSEIGTRLVTRFWGREVGRDLWGNRYFVTRNPKAGSAARRWVLFADDPAFARIPPLWHLWLNYVTVVPPQTLETPPPDFSHAENAQKNAKDSCLAPEHVVRGGGRGRSPRAYLPWRPTTRSSGGSFGRY